MVLIFRTVLEIPPLIRLATTRPTRLAAASRVFRFAFVAGRRPLKSWQIPQHVLLAQNSLPYMIGAISTFFSMPLVTTPAAVFVEQQARSRRRNWSMCESQRCACRPC